MKQTVAIDIETFDPNLLELGPGCIRKDGNVLSIGLYDGEEVKCLNPADQNEMQMLRDMLADPERTWVAHNGVYDYNWLQNGLGMQINGRMEDTMTREGLINEFAGSYSLDDCCIRNNVVGKNASDTIDVYWEQIGGKGKAVQNLPLIPKEIIDKYLAQDVRATFNLYNKQQPKLDHMRLNDINTIECMQYPFILAMKHYGIRVNVPRIEELTVEFNNKVNEGMQELQMKYGLTSLTTKKGPGSLPYVLKQLGLDKECLKTPTGDVSTAFNSIVRIQHPLAKRIIELKRQRTMLDKYLESALVKFTVGDRIHGDFKPTKRDDGGTITGRYASSNPNMQNFSARESKGGDLIRQVFLPEEGCILGAFDYKQIEYRLLAHFAIGPGAESLREKIGGGADYHQIVQDMLGWSGPDARKRVKVFNFGMSYGMGLNRFKENFELEAREAAAAMGMTTDQYTEHFYNEYIRRMTFLKPTTQSIIATALKFGYIRSLGGRVHHVPTDGRTYTMPNYLIQGSAADIMKIASAEAWKAGVFSVLTPHLTVHDELVFSIPLTREGAEACKELENCMTKEVEDDIENLSGVRLKVPIMIDPDAGPNWYAVDPKNNGGIHYLDNLYKEYGLV